MSDTFLRHDAQTEPLTLVRRLWGVFLLPVPMFTSLPRAPRWADALVLAVLLVSASSYAFAASDRGARLLVDRRVAFAEAAGRHVSAVDYGDLVVREQRGAMISAIIASLWLLIQIVATAGGALAIVSVLTTAGALRAPAMPPLRFRQALAISAHAGLIPAVGTPIRLLFNLWIGDAGPTTSVRALVTFIAEDTFWAHLANAIDLFGLWWAYTLAIGFACAALRRPDGLRLLFLGVYLALAVLLAGLKTLVAAPSF
jgi:hypothetical protein